MSKTEVLKTEEGKYQGFLRWDMYGEVPCISKFMALDEEPHHYLSERYFLNDKKKVIGVTEYTQSKKKRFGKELRSKMYEPTNYKKILAQEVEPISVNYHMTSNLKAKYGDVKMQAIATKEKVVERLYDGIDNANYIKESLGMMAKDKITETSTKAHDKTSSFFNSVKERLANNKEAFTSRIEHNKEQIFNKAANMKASFNQKATGLKESFISQKDKFKNSFKNVKQPKHSKTNQTISPIIIIINNQEDLPHTLRQLQEEKFDINQTQTRVVSNEEDILDYVNKLQNGEIEVYNELLDDVHVNSEPTQGIKI